MIVVLLSVNVHAVNVMDLHLMSIPRDLPKGIKHKVKLSRPAFMYLSGVAEGGEGKFCVPSMNLNRLCTHFVTLPVTPESSDTQNSLTEFLHFHIPKHTISDKILIPNQVVSWTNSDKAILTIANLNDHPVKMDNVYASVHYVKATFSPCVVLPNSE